MKRFVFFLALVLGLSYACTAQSSFDQEVKQLQSLIKEQSYNTAHPRAIKLHRKAMQSGTSRQKLVSAYYLSEIESAYAENAADSIESRLTLLCTKTNGVDKALSQALLMRFYHSYRTMNRYRLLANTETGETSLDYKLWSIKRYDSVITALQHAMIADTVLLKATSCDSLSPMVVSAFGRESGSAPSLFNKKNPSLNLDITPTLYDLLMNQAVETASTPAVKLEFLNMWRQSHNGNRSCLGLHLDMLWLQYQASQPNTPTADSATLSAYINMYSGVDCQERGDLLVRMGDYYHSQRRMEEALSCYHRALDSFPRCPLADDARYKIESITLPSIDLSMPSVNVSLSASLGTATVANLDEVEFSVVRASESTRNPKLEAILKLPRVKTWKQTVPRHEPYSTVKMYVYVPELPSGRYYLIAQGSADGRKQAAVTDFVCSRWHFVSKSNATDTIEGYLLDAASGRPIVGQSVEVQFVNGSPKTFSAQTDASGFFSVDCRANHSKGRATISTQCDGQTLSYTLYSYSRHSSSLRQDIKVFTDRPVYKPGETIGFSLVMYHTDAHRSASTLANRQLLVRLYDVNNVAVDSLLCVTDTFGNAAGRLIITPDALPGSMYIGVHEYNEGKVQRPTIAIAYVNVEAYKQPKFTVSLLEASGMQAFGKEMTVEGVASSYTSAPVMGASVQYTIVRQQAYFWKSAHRYYDQTTEEVAHGITTTDAEGRFAIRFTPTTDSAIDLGSVTYNYTVHVDVTDLNGESHSAGRAYQVGSEGRTVQARPLYTGGKLSAIACSYRTLRGGALKGEVRVIIDRLALPKHPKLRHKAYLSGSSVKHTLSRQEFEERYPLFAYSDEECMLEYLPVERPVFSRTITTSGRPADTVALPTITSGCYRLTCFAIDSHGDTVMSQQRFEYTAPNAERVASVDALWSEVSCDEARVGDVVKLRVGSRLGNMHLLVVLSQGGNTIMRAPVVINNDIKTFTIAVADSMRGGFTIELFATQAGLHLSKEYHISVPYDNKKLSLKWSTFRNKLSPASVETWTLTVNTPNEQGSANRQSARVIATMFDKALTTYGQLSFSFNPWQMYYGSSYQINEGIGSRSVYMRLLHPQWTITEKLNFVSASLATFYSARRYYKGAVHRNSLARGASPSTHDLDFAVDEVSLSVLADNESVETASELSNEGAFLEEEVSELDDATSNVMALGNEPGAVQVRSNLATSAFFCPSLTTDDSGKVSLSFTVPDLLTSWQVKAFGYTTDLKVGSLIDEAVTSKEIMVVPNAPRFLRQGDTIDLSVKVLNMTDSEQEIELSLSMLNPLTRTVVPMIIGASHATLMVDARSACSHSFRVSVPDSLWTVAYRVIATSHTFSDGEEAALPILTNRTLITESMSVYINGKGTKTYSLSSLKENRSATLRHHSLVVEATANPVWYAIQALPYMDEHTNPSNIYLANSIYANTLALEVVKSNPEIEKVFAIWASGDSSALLSQLLKRDDLRQTSLAETPWLRNGTSESQRMNNIALFFDKKSIARQLSESRRKLQAAQQSNGAWCWIDGCSYPSAYTTRYILTTCGHLSHLTGENLDKKTLKRALQYADSLNHETYTRALASGAKNYFDINYLYMRSFYERFEPVSKYKSAYNATYANALKSYKQQTSIMAQAKLATTFHRHGNKAAAKEIVRRLRERSITNPEMGMYWREHNETPSWLNNPIESQSLLIETFSEVTPSDVNSISLMRQWLLKQKQTTSWNSDVATASAIYALTCDGVDLSEEAASGLTVTVGSTPLDSPLQAGTGYRSMCFGQDEVTADKAELSLTKTTDGIAWGAMYWQYFEDLDKVKHSETGIKLQKQLYKLLGDGSMQRVDSNNRLNVGDKVRVRILIDCDRTVEYVELKDGRAAGFEPVSSSSGWHWNAGLSFYQAVGNASTSFFVDRMNKGKYVVEYDLWVTHSGTFTLGNCTLQCLYAPEFRSTAEGLRLTVNQKQ